MIAIVKALVDLYNDAPSLVDSIGSLRVMQISASAEPPYTILYPVAGMGPEDTFGGTLHIESQVVQFSIFDGTDSPNAILGYQELLQDRFDWATPTYTHDGEILALRCQRTSSGILMKDPDGVWQITVDYLVEYQK